MKNNSELINFIEAGMELASCLPLYFSKYSNKIYNNKQLTTVVVLKQKLKQPFRGLIEWLKANPFVCSLLGLKKIPHYTTIQKFFARISSIILDKLLVECNERVKRKKARVAVDATGFYPMNASSYYCLRYLKPSYRREYTKLSIVVDTDRQTIIAQKIRKAPAHDNIDFLHLTRKTIKAVNVLSLSADKAYDARNNFEFLAFHKIKAVIPIRNIQRKRIMGFYRRKAFSEFDMQLYHQRSKVESVFSAMKRKYGSVLFSKSFNLQRKELICKCLAYNIDRKIILVFH